MGFSALALGVVGGMKILALGGGWGGAYRNLNFPWVEKSHGCGAARRASKESPKNQPPAQSQLRIGGFGGLGGKSQALEFRVFSCVLLGLRLMV